MRKNERGIRYIDGIEGKKYIIIAGGNLSGIGKGTLTCSIGLLLKERGANVEIIKMEPYLNKDMSSMD